MRVDGCATTTGTSFPSTSTFLTMNTTMESTFSMPAETSQREQFIMSQKRGHAEMLLSIRKQSSREDAMTVSTVDTLQDAVKRGPAAMLLALRTQETAEPTSEGAKRRKLNSGMPTKRRVSFSNAQSVVEVETVSEDEKRNSWYATEDYSQFVCSAHRDAHVLKSAAESATSAESLFNFIQSNPDLSPRGLEKVMHHGQGPCTDDQSGNCASSMSLYSRKIRLLKTRHRKVLLSMHEDQKQSGQHNPEELRKFSESSSKWAVQTALKLGHIDANGLI